MLRKLEENNRMGKTRNVFKKIRDTKGIFHAKMGTIKDKSHMDQNHMEQKQRVLRRGSKNIQKTIQKRSS